MDVTLAGRAPGFGHGERHILASYYPVLRNAEVMGVAVVVRDVTEQDRAEEALRTSREEYRLLFEANPQPMWVYDLETLAFLAVNDAALRAYGYSSDEFLAMTLADIRPAEDAPALAASVGAPRVGTRTDGPWRHLRKDGSGLWVEIATSALDFGGRPARLITTLDVTERMVMEGERAQMKGERREATARQQTFLRDILASVTEGKLLLSNSSTQIRAPLTPVGEPVPLTREAGMNAIVHAGGGAARVFVGDTGTVQVRVKDRGTGIALARGFTTADSLGHGLKMMLETADRVYLLTGPEGTTAVIEQEREPPLPTWLSEALR